jgi:sugar phosphate isomerase/epimerase
MNPTWCVAGYVALGALWRDTGADTAVAAWRDRGTQLNDRVTPPPDEVYKPMTGRLLPGDGELPLAAILNAALESNPRLDVELEVFNSELRSLAPTMAAARIASSLRTWLQRHSLTSTLEK